MRQPHVEFDAGSAWMNKREASGGLLAGFRKEREWATPSSSSPSGPNANFLRRLIIPMQLPVDPAYAPELQLKCFDNRWGSSSLVGTTSVPLAPLMPWNERAFVPMTPNNFQVDDGAGPASMGRVAEQKAKMAQKAAELAQKAMAAKSSSGGGSGSSKAANKSSGAGDHAEAVEEDHSHDQGTGVFPAGDGDPANGFLMVPLSKEARGFSWLQDPAFGGGGTAALTQRRHRVRRKHKGAASGGGGGGGGGGGRRRGGGGGGDDGGKKSKKKSKKHGGGAEAGGKQHGDADDVFAELDGQWERPPFLDGAPRPRDWWLRQNGKELEYLLRNPTFQVLTRDFSVF